MGTSLDTTTILETLRELNAGVSVSLWLFGGVAVDFLVGRWTRAHRDIDLNTFSDARERLGTELAVLGYETRDTGWLTHWHKAPAGRHIEVVFLERSTDGTPELVIDAESSVGTPGRYRLWPGYMDLFRFGALDGVRFRVCSPEGEWLGRSRSVISGRHPEPKIEHDRRLLESVIPQDVLNRLQKMENWAKSPDPTALVPTSAASASAKASADRDAPVEPRF